MKFRGPGKHLHACTQHDAKHVATSTLALPRTVYGKSEYVVCAKFKTGPKPNYWPFDDRWIELAMTPSEAMWLAQSLVAGAERAIELEKLQTEGASCSS